MPAITTTLLNFVAGFTLGYDLYVTTYQQLPHYPSTDLVINGVATTLQDHIASLSHDQASSAKIGWYVAHSILASHDPDRWPATKVIGYYVTHIAKGVCDQCANGACFMCVNNQCDHN